MRRLSGALAATGAIVDIDFENKGLRGNYYESKFRIDGGKWFSVRTDKALVDAAGIGFRLKEDLAHLEAKGVMPDSVR